MILGLKRLRLFVVINPHGGPFYIANVLGRSCLSVTSCSPMGYERNVEESIQCTWHKNNLGVKVWGRAEPRHVFA